MKEFWPGWETIEGIGSGGFSKVYKIRKKGYDEAGEYYSALKVISIPTTSEEYDSYADEGYDDNTITGIFESQVKKLVEEFRLMAQFKGNSNIVSYEDHMIIPHEDQKGWDILIRMELLTSLTKHCSKNNMSVKEAIKLGIDICKALELCQAEKIIHRDIKPQNIFVSRYGDYKLGDFGIARSMEHTTRATKTGTYTYMAPEVYRGDPYNSTIDMYSLGLVLYWILNEKRLPFLPLPPEAPTAAMINEAQARRLSGEKIPAPKNGTETLKRIVLKACSHAPSMRFVSANEMRRALEREYLMITDSESDDIAQTNMVESAEVVSEYAETSQISPTVNCNVQTSSDETVMMSDELTMGMTSDDKTMAIGSADKASVGNQNLNGNEEISDKTVAIKNEKVASINQQGAPVQNIVENQPIRQDRNESAKKKIMLVAAALYALLVAGLVALNVYIFLN